MPMLITTVEKDMKQNRLHYRLQLSLLLRGPPLDKFILMVCCNYGNRWSL